MLITADSLIETMMLTMNLWHLLILLSLAVNLIVCFPSRPLNERSSELAWQAWLLVDDQNGKQNGNDDAMLRRRIHPKSVFIAPTFSPTDLPPCADGYQSDNMGRCIRIIKIDEAAQLENLLHKLNADFGNPNNKNVNFNLPGSGNSNDNDYYDTIVDEEEVDESTSGPLQVNIPLGGIKEPEIAIIVAPTRNNFEDVSLKFDQKREDRFETTTVVVVDDSTTTTSDENFTTDVSVTETSTNNESTVTETTAETVTESTTIPTTVTEPTVTEISPSSSTTELTTTTVTEATETSSDQNIGEFEDEILLPGEDSSISNDLNLVHEKRSTTTTTTTEAITETTEFSTIHSETTTTNNPIFKDDFISLNQKLPLLKPRTLSGPLRSSSTVNLPFVEDIHHQQVPRSTSNTNRHSIMQTAQPTIKTAQPTIEPVSPTTTIESSSVKSSHHRNRDKTSSFGFYFPPSGAGGGGTIRPKHLRSLTSDSSQFLSSLNLNNQVNNAQNNNNNKPVIFRFSGKHAYVDSQLFKQQPDYYRSLPSDDLSYLFGFKNKQITHR